MRLANLASVLLVLAFIGCKLEKKEKNSSTLLGNIALNAERNFTELEVSIGKRICQSLKKKREFFETLPSDQEKFRFRSELKNCDGGLYSEAVFVASISTNSSELGYNSNSENTFKEIITEQLLPFKDICNSLLTSATSLNVIEEKDIRYSFNLLVAEGLDRIELTRSKKSADGSFKILNAEGVSIFTQASQAGSKFLGVEKERVRYTPCDAKGFSSMRQSWLNAVTNF